MDTQPTATLVKLSDSNLTVDDPKADVRGRKVVDKDGHEVGKVDDLLLDDREHKVRFLEVESGGFLGMGETKVLVPVDAITKIDDHAVHINQTREHVVRAPRYDPALVKDVRYVGNVYNHYGYGPYWGAGYIYPPFPYSYF